MTPAQRELRNRLRAHGRQLGDRRDDRRGVQGIDRLTTECAYEHWHRMLFARYPGGDANCSSSRSLAWRSRWRSARSWPATQGRDWLEARRRLRAAHAAADLPLRRSGARSGAAAGDALGARRPDEGAAARRVRRRRQPRLGLPVLAGGPQGRGQPVREEDRRRRAAGGDAVVHRGLHGALPAAQHAGRVVGRQGARGKPASGRVGIERGRAARGLRGRRCRVDLLALRA